MIGDRELKLDDYLDIARRRFWWLVVPAIVVPILTFAVTLKIPNRYTSQTTVLVEQQKVPGEFVKPVITEDLSARLSTMTEQILSRSRLEPLIIRFGLFKADQGRVPMEDLLDRVRKLIRVEPMRADGSRGGSMSGFSISFTAGSARLAQQVVTEITSMYVEENLHARERRVGETTDFLRSQLEAAKQKLDEQDARLAAFKMKYSGQLPENEQTNLSMLATLNSQLDATTQMLARAQQDKTYSESLLAQQLAAWRASRTGPSPDTLDHQLSVLQSQLINLQSKYTDNHPDIIKLKREIAKLKKEIEENGANSDSDVMSKAPSASEPPQLKQLRLQIHQLESVVKERAAEQQRLRQQIALYQSRVQLSPKVEEEYKLLTRDYTTAQKTYDELLANKTQAERARELELRQQGEQFRVMDPANLPEKPAYPNRMKFTAAGFAGGLALGFGMIVILELRDKSMRTDRDIEFFLKLPTLAMVPPVGNGVPRGKMAAGSRRAQQVIGA